ncbi:MAG: Hpt domain-containing protein [Polyangiales bacterium]
MSEFVDDPDVADMVAAFVRVAAVRADEVLTALAQGDDSTVRRLVHQLKGAAGGYGFPTITEQAVRVEAALETRDAAKVAGAVQALSTLCYRAGRGAVETHAA